MLLHSNLCLRFSGFETLFLMLFFKIPNILEMTNLPNACHPEDTNKNEKHLLTNT